MKDVGPSTALKSSFALDAWHVYQGKTNDCGPYCVTIVTNGVYGARLVNEKALAEELSHRGFPDRIPGWATLPWGMVRSLRTLGLAARWRFGVSFEQLFGNLRNGITTIVIIGEPLRFVKRKLKDDVKSGTADAGEKKQDSLRTAILRRIPKWGGWSHYKVFYRWEPGEGLGFVDPQTSRASGMTWQTLDEFRREWNWMGRQIVEVRRP